MKISIMKKNLKSGYSCLVTRVGAEVRGGLGRQVTSPKYVTKLIVLQERVEMNLIELVV